MATHETTLSSSQVTTVNPNVAALLTWFVPGGGHFLLGNVRLAVMAFVAIEGLYLLGVILSGGMFLEILPPEMRGRFAAALTPEAGNLGALLVHVSQYGYGSGLPRPFPDGLHLGVMLTSAAGILNLILASRAHFDARTARGIPVPSAAPNPGLSALFGWLIPGAGHLSQGRKARGLLAFVLVVGLFFLGCYLAEGTNLNRSRHFYYWAGQSFLGPIAFIAEHIHGQPRLTERVAYADAGVVVSSIAGMLNVLLLLDVYGFGEARLLGRPIATEADPEVDPEVDPGARSDGLNDAETA